MVSVTPAPKASCLGKVPAQVHCVFGDLQSSLEESSQKTASGNPDRYPSVFQLRLHLLQAWRSA